MAEHTAFVLAAGFGTRLRPLTEVVPKPLVPVCGVPMLAYALALCAKHGHTHVMVNGHYLAEQLRPWAGEHEGVHVTLSIEQPDILGTGGGLKKVVRELSERFAIVNADILADVDLTALVNAVPDGGAAMALRAADDASTYGIVAADDAGVVVDLVGKATASPEGAVHRDTHFSGIHAMHRASLDKVPVAFSSVITDSYVHTVPKRLVRGLRHDGVWLDVGNPRLYLQANLAVLRREVNLPLDPFERGSDARPDGVVIHGDLWLAESAVVAPGAMLEDCIIGHGAIVPQDAVLRRVVVWDGARVPSGELSDAIVLSDGRVVSAAS